jgi:hypothetical protein
MSSANALQHYVPQFLLRGFASRKRHQLYVFDKRTGRSFRSSVRNAGCERGFYDPHNKEDSDVDEWVKRVEAEAGGTVADIRRNGNLKNLTHGDREWLAAFVAIQMVRTKRHLTAQDDLSKAFASALRARGADPSDIPGFGEFDAETLRAEFLKGIQSMSQKLFAYLNGKVVVLFASDRRNPCWISDHPVVRYNSLNPGDGIQGTAGVACTGIEIYLPIDSQHILGFLCSSIEEYFRNARRLFSIVPVPALINEMLDGISKGEPITAEEMNVTFFNFLQVSQSEQYLFAEDNNFELAQRILRDDPRFKEGPKPEIVGMESRAEE